jgi:metal-sulfur cluster biosynthetic enzyme
MNATDADKLKMLILMRLRQVIDPETNADVIRMQLVKDLIVTDQGEVSYTFRPSSPICPIAVYLAQQIKAAVNEVPGVTRQHIAIEDYIAAEELTELINKET